LVLFVLAVASMLAAGTAASTLDGFLDHLGDEAVGDFGLDQRPAGRLP
jgi:hypothetical protein